MLGVQGLQTDLVFSRKIPSCFYGASHKVWHRFQTHPNHVARKRARDLARLPGCRQYPWRWPERLPPPYHLLRCPGCTAALDLEARVEYAERAGIRRPRGPLPLAPTSFVSHRPGLRKLFLRVTAKGRPGSQEELFPCNPGGRRAREGRGGGGSAEGPVFAFISSNRRFYLWKRTDAGD